ncbi:hypothetical protein [Mesorhizobium sp. LjNodule214]|uniref:hypothetical protein n=1 Tax=Mesorhizobium sp. LjNodule214 TaxID=3342252 RepID=UPI003ECF7BCB
MARFRLFLPRGASDRRSAPRRRRRAVEADLGRITRQPQRFGNRQCGQTLRGLGRELCRSASRTMDYGRRSFAGAFVIAWGAAGIGQIAEPYGEAGDKGRMTKRAPQPVGTKDEAVSCRISALVLIKPRNLGSSFIP